MHGIIRHGRLGLLWCLWVSLLFIGRHVVIHTHDHSMHKAPAAKSRRENACREGRRGEGRHEASPAQAQPLPTPHHTCRHADAAASPLQAHINTRRHAERGFSCSESTSHTPGMPMPALLRLQAHINTRRACRCRRLLRLQAAASPHHAGTCRRRVLGSESASHTPPASPSASPTGHIPGMHAAGMTWGRY